MILTENLTQRYGRHEVLRGLSLDAREGEVTLLIGSNGAGKTTTLRILAGLGRASSGSARVAGIDVLRHRRRAQRQLSYLPQGVAFHPRLSCRQVLGFYARLRGVDRGRIDHVLDLTGLAVHAEKRAGKLSGGLRQRLGLATLLLPDVPVLLLDEPGLSLDPEWRGKLQSLLRDEAARGKTVLVTTHLLAEWEGAADRCLSCRDGRIEGEVDPDRLRPENRILIPFLKQAV
ncbi:ABC transporter ATP-binding protein [Haloferula sargassicola]|uniref:ABC transporter ATP-binding protein YxlF n=1 Tax=Haloferula sargassicola TaxID=490096 RepID=A0ABP9ULV6_9BACT